MHLKHNEGIFPDLIIPYYVKSSLKQKYFMGSRVDALINDDLQLFRLNNVSFINLSE
tara:strand:+ start:6432 stop:6602 length:171 start_codon:yes stop_codon:yes gene_type:complete